MSTVTKKEIGKRYSLLILGIIFISFGIAIITKADLGTSPISAVPYSLSLIWTFFTLGNWTILFNLFLIVMEILILKGNVNKAEILVQFVLTFLFGYCIDLAMLLLTALAPQLYIMKVLTLLIGCVVLAFGAYLQVIANVAMLPGDAYVRALITLFKKEFGTVRVISDISMTLTAAALCLIFLHNLDGVREGTVIAALIVGNIVRVFCHKLQRLTDFLLPEEKTQQTQEETPISADRHFVLTISREFGTGGREIGRKLAEKLNISYYDSDTVQEAAAQSGYIDLEKIKKEKVISNYLLYDFYSWYTAALNEQDMPEPEQLFRAESKVLKEITARESCVIVGRMASHILRDHPNALHVFITGDRKARIQRIMERDHLTQEETEQKIQRVDKERANYFRSLANTKWDDMQNYDIAINSSKYGPERTIDILYWLAREVITAHNITITEFPAAASSTQTEITKIKEIEKKAQ